MEYVLISISTKFGIAPIYATELAADTYDRSGTITSSFFLTPDAIKAKCSADVPLITGTIYFFFKIFSNLFLNFSK